MKEYIVKYYLSEVHGAAVNIVVGVVFIILAIVLWRTGVVHGINRGLAYALFGGGLFFSVVCVGVVIHNKQMVTKTEQTVTDNKELQSSEITRMEKVLKSGFVGGLIQFSLCIVVGLIFVLVGAKGNLLLKGIGIGLLILGTFGHITEAYSMKRNNAYLNEVKELKL